MRDLHETGILIPYLLCLATRKGETTMKSIINGGRYLRSSRHVINLISGSFGVSQKGSASNEFPVKFPNV